MSRFLVASLALSMVWLSACGEFLQPIPTDAGVCGAVSNGDGGQTLVPIEGLDFPRGGTVCLEPGASYVVHVESHALTSVSVKPTEGAAAVNVTRGGAAIHSATGSSEVRGWVYVGRDPLTVTVRNEGSTARLVFDYSFSILGMAATRVGPLALADGGVGLRPAEPTLDFTMAPVLVPVTTASNPTFEFGIDRAIENVIVNGDCATTAPFPERYLAIELDAGTYRLGDLGMLGRDYRIRAVGTDGGTLVTGMVSQLATLDLNLARAQRVFVTANIADTRATCGFDGGTAPGLIGSASFSVR
ncbi:MAG: hypothetical protein JNM17_05450 [Archangium sp.]|nr:hypothetical protein [Archangium sp.]